MSGTHVLLISQQPLPNLTPLVDPEIKPDRVVLLVSHDMKERAQWLEQLAKSNGIETVQIEISNAWDIQAIQQTIAELIVEYCDTELKLNATGGTKPMSIAAYEEFRSQDLPVYYVHPESGSMIWMHDKEQPVHNISERIKLETLLAAHGANVIEIHRNRPRSKDIELAQTIINSIDHYGHAVSELNSLAYSAQNAALKSNMISAIDSTNREALEDLIDLFDMHGSLSQKGDQLQFRDKNSRQFVNGLWFESWVYHQIIQLGHSTPGIHDMAYDLTLDRQLERGKPVRNQLDTAFLHNNRLHIIECKTRRMKGKDTTGTDALYKLEALKPIMGGLQARAMLISLLPVPDHDKTRASELGISILESRQLTDAQAQLKRFMS